MLFDSAIFLAAAVIFVPLFRRLGLGSVLGYLAAGIAIGPWGFQFIGDVESIFHFSEFGVVLLLFVIGLELQPSRLWTLRHTIFGLGGAQVALTTIALTLAGYTLGLKVSAAFVAGFGLAMSSTAFALQMLAEKKELATRHGRVSFAILLFQDMSVIPFMALVPLLAVETSQAGGGNAWFAVAKAFAIVGGVIIGGRYTMRPFLRLLARTQIPEIFTAAALLVVMGTAIAMQWAGLSMSLGAFLAGVLLADSEYRHELQADIEPFKGLLLGLFFIAVGMSADIGLLLHEPLRVLGLVGGLLAIKAAVLYFIARRSDLPPNSSVALASMLPQGGEFAFVLFGIAVTAGVMDHALESLLVIVVTLSMALTPFLHFLRVRLSTVEAPPPYDTIDAPDNEVIIAGFGPFGQIIGRLLRLKKIGFTVLEKDYTQVDFVRRFGSKVYYGDASRLELLRAAHAERARYFVLAISDPETSLHVASIVRMHFPHLKIFAEAKNRNHVLKLMDMGIPYIMRRSYHSSLTMARDLLAELGYGHDDAQRSIELFRVNDEITMKKQAAVVNNEQAVLQTAKEAAQELEQLFEADTRMSREPEPPTDSAYEKN
jgi:glutathione-regulated potassium-efflux system ancillary protein KefC/glutathione-regulated potassium-efflux system protein KefB